MRLNEAKFFRSYITTTEWKNEWGGKKAARGLNDPDHVDFRRLPFDHCALSLQPYETPYADSDGHVFDLGHIVRDGLICLGFRARITNNARHCSSSTLFSNADNIFLHNRIAKPFHVFFRWRNAALYVHIEHLRVWAPFQRDVIATVVVILANYETGDRGVRFDAIYFPPVD